jgi:hypothetical protein
MTRSSVVLVLVLSSSPFPALRARAAEDPVEGRAVLDKLVEINQKALDELRLGNSEAARTDLTRAVTLGKRAGLAGHQIMARTHLHLGAVYLTGFGDRAKALRELTAAVKIKPGIQVTPQITTPSLAEALEEARAHAGVALPPTSAPVAVATTAGVTHSSATASSGASGEAPTELIAAAPEPRRQHRIWAGLGLGSGLGWHTRQNDLEAQNDFALSSGVSGAALLHLSPELGYRWSDRTAFSVQTRHQLIPSSGHLAADTRAHWAHAVFLRAHRQLAELGDRLQLWGTASLGGGSAIRLYVPPNARAGLGASDTVSVGPLALGPGVSLAYAAGGRLSLVATVNVLAAVWRFAALADFDVGATYAF